MDRGLNSLNTPTKIVESSPASSRIENPPQLSTEYINDLATLEDSLGVGRDYLEATGEYPAYENFQALHLNGHFEYSLTDIKRIFGSWEVFQGDIQNSFTDYQQSLEKQKKEMLETIALDQHIGVLHPLLFRKTTPGRSPDRAALKDLGVKTRFNLEVILESEVDENERIERYVRFKIAERLTSNMEIENGKTNPKAKVDPLTRRTSIALGFNIETGRRQSSFKSEIAKSNCALNMEEIEYRIEEIARDNNWLTFLYQSNRKKHLEQLKKDSTLPQQIDLLPPKNRILPSRGENDSGSGKNRKEVDYFYSLQTGQLLLGRVAIKEFLKEPSNRKEDIHKLSTLLRQKDIDVSFNNPDKDKEWTKDTYIKYGRWLLKALNQGEAEEMTLTKSVLQKAASLGIGPSIHKLRTKKRFGTLINYYREVGLDKRNRYGEFDNFTFEDFVSHIQKVTDEIGEAPTQKMLWRRINEEGRYDEPSPAIIRAKTGGNLAGVFEAAGVPFKKAKSLDDYVSEGVKFARDNNGKIPTASDCNSSEQLSCSSSILKRFGSLSSYQEKITAALGSTDHSEVFIEHEIAA